MNVGVDSTNTAISADLTFYSAAWQEENFPILADGAGNYGGIAVYQPIVLGGGTGCLADNATTQVGDTPQSIAEQLAQLPRSTVLNPPRPVQALGRPAVHVRVRINNDCGADVYRVAVTTERGGHGISYGDDSTKNIVVDFWVMDVGGSPVVVETWHEDDASSRLMQEIAHTFESVTFVTGG
jgi:hypothetical protein